MNREDLETLRKGIDFETKLAASPDRCGRLPRTFWETCNSVANTQGCRRRAFPQWGLVPKARSWSRVILGPDDGFDIRGLPDAHRIEADLRNTLNNGRKNSAQCRTSMTDPDHHTGLLGQALAKRLSAPCLSPGDQRAVHCPRELAEATP